MKKYVPLLIVILSVLIAFPAAANSTIFGPTGLVKVPTADPVPEQRLSLDYQLVGMETNILNSRYGLNEDVELGLNLGITSDNNLEPMVHIKARLLKETDRYPALAAGIVKDSVYIVGSKSLGFPGLRGHLGVGNGLYQGFFFGVNRVFNPVAVAMADEDVNLPVVNLMAEYFNREFNLGAELHFNPLLSAELNLIDLQEVAIGINCNFDF